MWHNIAETVATATGASVCQVCLKSGCSEYVCPRCEIRYCSVHCYRTHSKKCTQHDFLAQVTEKLQPLLNGEQNCLGGNSGSGSAGAESEDDMPEDGSFDYYRGEGGEQEGGEQESGEQESGEDGGGDEGETDAADTDSYPPEVHTAFMRALAAGEVRAPQWVPWWVSNVDLPRATSANLPPAHVCCCSGSQCSPRCFYWLLRLVYAYAWLLRRVNGEFEELSEGDEKELVIIHFFPWLTSVRKRKEVPENTLREACEALLNSSPPDGHFETGAPMDEKRANLRCLRDGVLLLATPVFTDIVFDFYQTLDLRDEMARRKLTFLRSFYYWHFCVAATAATEPISSFSDDQVTPEVRLDWVLLEPTLAQLEAAMHVEASGIA